MSARHFPVRPDLEQLKHQAKDLLRGFRNGDPGALAELHELHPRSIEPASAKLADAQLVLARSYGAPSWARLVHSCQLIDAIWRDDATAVRELVVRHPRLLHENAGIRNGNWGPPMTYAANLGRDRIIRMLHELGARDLMSAIDRAALQSKVDTARMLHAMAGTPALTHDALSGPAYTLSAPGTALVLSLGAPVRDADGAGIAPVNVVLESDSRNPAAKHAILEMYVQYGMPLPDTPPMALHRGRIDLLEDHLRRDPNLLIRTFAHEEIYPPELQCHDEVTAIQGTPLKGTTLLHMCADYDEIDIARWLLERGMNPDARAAIDADGFGGHTALFGTVVSQPAFWMNLHRQPPTAPFSQLLLDFGADPNVRASLRKRLHPDYEEGDALEEYRDVTPRSWGVRYGHKRFVNAAAVELIVARGGRE